MTKEEYQKAVTRIEWLFKQTKFSSTEQQEFLRLTNLIEEYEKYHPEDIKIEYKLSYVPSFLEKVFNFIC